MHSTLTVFFVSFALTSVQPEDQIAVAREVNHETEIGENLHHLFDSIRTDDAKKTETYRKFLVEQAVKEQETFDSLKGEMRFSRQRNARKQGHFNERSHDVREKRAVCEQPINHAEMEEQFVKLYGSNNETSGVWQAVRDCASDVDRLKKIVLQAHKASYPVLKLTAEKIEKITFDTHRTLLTNHSQPIRLDTILYSIPKITMINFVISKGLAPDCVFYLHEYDIYTREPEVDVFETNPTALKLSWHHCNITI